MIIASENGSRTRPEPPRRRYNEVLEAAARVFHKKGYRSTSIQDIAEEVGLLKGSLYYYIRSKDDLLYEIIEGVHADALENIASLDEVEGDALQKIRAFVTAHFAFNAANLTRMGIFFRDFRSLDPERRQTIVAARDSYEQRLRGLIRQGQAQGIVCGDIDATVAAVGIMGMLNWIYQWYVPTGAGSLDELASGFADFAVGGLACSSEAHVPGPRLAAAAAGEGAP